MEKTFNRRAILKGFAALMGSAAASSVAKAAQCYGGPSDAFIEGCPTPAGAAYTGGDIYIQSSSKPIVDRPEVWKRYSAKPELVDMPGNHYVGNILIDEIDRYLYLIQPQGKAIRYVIGTGRKGTQITGLNSFVFAKMDNAPDAHGNRGPATALGAHCLYLRIGSPDKPGRDEGLGIHGTNAPHLLAGERRISGGCFRMHNEDIKDLASRVKVGTQVVFFRHAEIVARQRPTAVAPP